MLVGALAFVQHSALIGASQAAACAGSMPEPAILVHGPVHLHDDLARHLHAHAGDNHVGHVHHGADPENQDADGRGLFFTCGCSPAVIPAASAGAMPFEAVGRLDLAPQRRPDGVEPDGPSKPPSTPSIA
jgi:hypothetical protein